MAVWPILNSHLPPLAQLGLALHVLSPICRLATQVPVPVLHKPEQQSDGPEQPVCPTLRQEMQEPSAWQKPEQQPPSTPLQSALLPGGAQYKHLSVPVPVPSSMQSIDSP